AGVAPVEGISAITLAAKAVAKMALGRIDDETTANIGRLEGGKQTNIVCDHVEILADARSLIPEKMEAQVAKMKEAFETTAQEHGLEADVEVQVMYPDFKEKRVDQVVEMSGESAEAIGRYSQLLTSGGANDANVISSFGIPTVNFAVGNKEFHTTNELMPI